MKIKDILQPESLIYMERYVNAESRNYSQFADFIGVKDEFKPTGDTESFQVPRFSVPQSTVEIFKDQEGNSLHATYLDGAMVNFAVHPEIIDDATVPHLANILKYQKYDSLTAAATSSTRTVRIFGDAGRGVPAHFTKLHCPRRVSRFVRRLRKVSVQFSVKISEDLRAFASDAFGFLPETLGVTVGDYTDGWGFIVREDRPFPYVAEPRYLIPFFSLYAVDQKNPTDLPLLVQLINHHKADPIDFTFNHIMAPLITSWCLAIQERGIMFGAHAQNVLLEVDAELKPTRVIHRDLDLQVDPMIRERKGLHNDFLKSRIGIDLSAPRVALYSLKYDSFMGHHLFDYIARTLETHYSIDRTILQQKAKAAFKQAFPDSSEFLADTVYYYENKSSPDNEVALVDTHVKPTWR